MNLSDIADTWASRQYNRGHILIYAGDDVNRFFYIKKGYVKVYNITEDGDEHVLLILKARDLFPLVQDPNQTKTTSLYFYETMTPVELLVVEQKQLLDRVRQNINSSWELLRYTSEFSSTLTNRLAQLESKKAEDKLENLFAYLIMVCGKMTKLNAYLLDLKLTHQDIASLIGLTRETVSIEMKKLETQGKVINRKGHLLVDKGYLESIQN